MTKEEILSQYYGNVYEEPEEFIEIIKAMEQYRNEGLREELQTPIEDGLYATGRFTQDECSVLAEGLLMYINEYLKQKP